MKKIILSFIILMFPVFVLAHQPNIVSENLTEVVDPEISKAYYSELDGKSHKYKIESEEDFLLYTSILVPFNEDHRTDFEFMVQNVDTGEILFETNSNKFDWQLFYEPFGADYYVEGPSFEKEVSAGNYRIVVYNPGNSGKYSLAVGKIEKFGISDFFSSIEQIVYLKENFFGSAVVTFIKSPLAWVYIIIIFLISFAFGFVLKYILKEVKFNKSKSSNNNIGSFDRFIRLVLAIFLFFWGINTFSFWVLFLSGFCLFESLFKWCGFYALINKNTCV